MVYLQIGHNMWRDGAGWPVSSSEDSENILSFYYNYIKYSTIMNIRNDKIIADSAQPLKLNYKLSELVISTNVGLSDDR